jgi:hypothetical protein
VPLKTPDSVAQSMTPMSAAFPYIVYEALPKAPDVTPAQSKALGNYPININVAVDIKLDKYIHQLSGVGWEAVRDELEKVIAPILPERAALCKTLEKHLEEALCNGISFNKSTDLALGMVGPRDMKCEDYPKYPLGRRLPLHWNPGRTYLILRSLRVRIIREPDG